MLLEELKEEYSTAILYITHNLGVVARVCDRVAVMYAGEMVEEGAVIDLFERPLHPYTINLLNCVPRFVGWSDGQRDGVGGPGAGGPGATALGVTSCSAAGLETRLATIPGSLPQPDDLPPGCVFAPRCPVAFERCSTEWPPFEAASEGHRTRCWRWESLLSDEGRRGAVSLPQCAPPIQQPAGGPGQAAGTPVPIAAAPGEDHFLTVSDVSKLYQGAGRSKTRAVDGVTTFVDQAKTLGLVGESGSGKTSLARVVSGLTAPSRGRVLMEGDPLAPETGDRKRDVLRRLQMVFQNPDASLNPRRTVGQAVIRPLLTLGRLDRDHAARRVYELLEAVRLPASYFHRYPAELSGGEKQRVAIARAFAAAPDLVICDEPISSLDVSVQGSLMNLLVDLQAEQGTSYLFISHDVAAIQHLSHRIAVMYLGALMEQGDAALVLAPPYHPYTEALLSAIPVPDPRARRRAVRLHTGTPTSGEIPSGCRFHPRCPRRLGPICQTTTPPWRSAREELGDHEICCHIPLEELLTLQVAPDFEGPRQ